MKSKKPTIRGGSQNAGHLFPSCQITMSVKRRKDRTHGNEQFIMWGNETSSSHLWCVFFSGDLRPKPFLFLPSWSGFIWWLVTPRPCSCLLSFLMLPPPSHSILLVTGHHTLVISRYSDPGGSGSPFTGDWAVCAFSWLSAAQSESFSALLSPTPQTWRAFQKSRFFLFVCLEKAHWLRVAILFKILTEIIF